MPSVHLESSQNPSDRPCRALCGGAVGRLPYEPVGFQATGRDRLAGSDAESLARGYGRSQASVGPLSTEAIRCTAY